MIGALASALVPGVRAGPEVAVDLGARVDLEESHDDVASGNNAMGSRPDGWWRNRAEAAERLVDEIAAVHDH